MEEWSTDSSDDEDVSWEEDVDHLACIMGTLGSFPRWKKVKRDFFNAKGGLIGNPVISSIPLHERLESKRPQVASINSLLAPMLRYHPSQRASIEDALAHPWWTQNTIASQ